MFEPPMGWPSSAPRPETTRPSDAADFWYSGTARPSESGVIVTDDKAMAVATFFACLRVLSQAIASMPLIIYRRLDSGGKTRAVDDEWYNVFHDQPNSYQTSAEWKLLGMAWLVLRGNWYCRMIKVNGQWNLYPLHPDRMRVKLMDTGRLYYEYRPFVGQEQIYGPNEILHIRGLSLDGIVGVSVLTYARNALGLSVAQETHGAKLFANGSLPPFALETPEIMNERAVGNFRSGWRGMHAGSKNAYNPPILQGGMKIHELSLTNEDSQWLESRKFQAEEICRFTGVPPHMAGILDRATFSNIEHQGIEFVRYTLRPWCTLWQQAIQRDVVQDDQLFVEFLLDDLQRGDTPSRYSAYNIGLQSGFLTRNEVRAWENLNPIPGGDTAMEPLNMAPIGSREETPTRTVTRDEEPEGDRKRERRVAKKQKRKQVVDAFLPLVRDAAERLAAAENRALASRIDRAAEDRAAWMEWTTAWYAKHERYMQDTLTPLAASWHSLTRQTVDVAAYAVAMRNETLRQLADCDPQLVLVEWQEVRVSILTQSILGKCFHVSGNP